MSVAPQVCAECGKPVGLFGPLSAIDCETDRHRTDGIDPMLCPWCLWHEIVMNRERDWMARRHRVNRRKVRA
jgi:hypothetical protein